MKAFVIFGNNELSLVLDKSEKYVIAVEGTKEDILLWLRGMNGVTDEAIKSFEEAMEV